MESLSKVCTKNELIVCYFWGDYKRSHSYIEKWLMSFFKICMLKPSDWLRMKACWMELRRNISWWNALNKNYYASHHLSVAFLGTSSKCLSWTVGLQSLAKNMMRGILLSREIRFRLKYPEYSKWKHFRNKWIANSL